MAISWPRAATAEYIVLSAPKVAPTAISNGDRVAERAHQVAQHLRLRRVVVVLARHVDLEPGVGRERVLEALEGVGRLELGVHRLEVVAAPVGRLEHARVGPDLGLVHRALGAEDADHLPDVLAPAQRVADLEPGELARRRLPDDDLVASRPRRADPATISTCGRTAKAVGSTPRIGTLAPVPVLRLGTSTMTNSSADATGPFAPRATPGASLMIRVCSSSSTLDISVSLPARSTSAVPDEVPLSMTLRKPSAIDSTATNTATTPAKPTTATLDEPSRCRRLIRFTPVTASVCDEPAHAQRLRSASTIVSRRAR